MGFETSFRNFHVAHQENKVKEEYTPLLPLLPGRLCPGVVAADTALTMGEIELTAYLC